MIFIFGLLTKATEAENTVALVTLTVTVPPPPIEGRVVAGTIVAFLAGDDASGASAYADRVLLLADGRVVDEMVDPTADRVLERMKRFGE